MESSLNHVFILSDLELFAINLLVQFFVAKCDSFNRLACYLGYVNYLS